MHIAAAFTLDNSRYPQVPVSKSLIRLCRYACAATRRCKFPLVSQFLGWLRLFHGCDLVTNSSRGANLSRASSAFPDVPETVLAFWR